MRKRIFFQYVIWLLLFNIFCISNAFAADRIVNLIVSYKIVNFTGKPAKAIVVNNQLPGPTLHFQEGDHVTINVFNHLDKGTTIHWHGLIVPWQMDGVEGVSQAAIPPGGVFHYQFTLHQSGTYWYHAHSELQEQQGLYGAIIIDPKQPTPYHYNKDFVVVLSDWSNTSPETIYANLKRNNDHKTMQQTRMSGDDLSDVAYDTFLLNGKPTTYPWTKLVKVGDIVRLRFIGAGASTVFQVKIAGTTMEMVHVQGHDIKPYMVNNFSIAPGETYDVLVKIQQNKPYVIYAESADASGVAIGALITQPEQSINYQKIKPFPRPKPIGMSTNMSGMNMSQSSMSGMASSNIMQSSMTKYQNLQSLYKTNDPNKPVHIIKMVLTGYMGSYVWMINGLTQDKAQPILIEHGQRYRLIFINNSMMDHPMHLHGHWFILRNGHGAYDPLLHTIDVPPGAIVVADFDADASGQWFFHCHNLYHMAAGMSRIFRYTTFAADKESKEIN